jgi:hypothetical protein
MTALRSFFTRSRLIAFVGVVTALWGIAEESGALATIPKPYAPWVAAAGAVVAWLGRSGLADKKAPPPVEPVE